MIGHPKLKNDLERPTMAEIGHRTNIFPHRPHCGTLHDGATNSRTLGKSSGGRSCNSRATD
jgi:type II secretory pathway predicted ATPase ExeA